MQPATRQIIAQGSTNQGDAKDILDMLLSDSEDDTVRQKKLQIKGVKHGALG